MDRTSNSRKNISVLRIVNGVLFATFSFVFLYFMQGELLSEAQFVYSKGITTYSIFPGAIIITFVLMLLQWVITLVLHFNKSYYALSYFPSCFVLGLFTSIDKDTLSNFTFVNFIWSVLLFFFLYVVVILLLWKIFLIKGLNVQKKSTNVLWINALILFVMFLFVGSYANNNDVFTYELKTERLIMEGKYENATKVGEKSLLSSRRLTELRMFALAKGRRLHEEMFNYPHYYGTEGLLDISDTLSKIYRITPKHICETIGLPANCINSTKEYFKHIGYLIDSLSTIKINSEEEGTVYTQKLIDKQMVVDYYRAYLLLSKDLDGLCKSLGTDVYSKLPKVYSESMLLAYEKFINTHVDSADNAISSLLPKLHSMISPEVIKQRDEYLKMKENLPDNVECMNRMRRKFGNTYWWYYDYSDVLKMPEY